MIERRTIGGGSSDTTGGSSYYDNIYAIIIVIAFNYSVDAVDIAPNFVNKLIDIPHDDSVLDEVVYEASMVEEGFDLTIDVERPSR